MKERIHVMVCVLGVLLYFVLGYAGGKYVHLLLPEFFEHSIIFFLCRFFAVLMGVFLADYVNYFIRQKLGLKQSYVDNGWITSSSAIPN